MDQNRYAELFLTESRDNLSAINHSLLELERTPDATAPVGALFRAVHTVKGMSATMGYTAVAELSHELENLLDEVRRGARRVTPTLMDLLFQSADALEQAIELAVAGRDAGASGLPILSRLRALASASSSDAASDSVALEPPPGSGVLVRVEQDADTPMRGVRAFLAVERARSIGDVAGVSPSLEALQGERFGTTFLIRLDTDLADEEIARTIMAAGGVQRVLVDRGGGFSSSTESTPPPQSDATAMQAAFAAEAAQPRQHRYVRIDLQRLDVLLNLIGELVITRGRLQQLAASLADSALDETVTQASRLITDLQDGIMSSRMVPAWQIFDRFPRLVRDAARSVGKQVSLEIEGQDVELDRSVLDEIGDPIVHLLRNAIDHGLEMPDERVAAGKPSAGRLSLTAARDRSAIVIRVTDDGRGIDRERVLARARELGLDEASRGDLSDEDVLRLISRPGFSTARTVSALSGRGVGIDVVSSRIRALGGTVEIRSVQGEGTQVTVRLPVTLAIVRALLARVAGETYAIPMTHVNETVHLDEGARRTVKGREVFVLRDEVLPLVYLRERVRLPGRDGNGGQVVVIEVAERRAGLVVDELTGQQEIVIKPYDTVLGGVSLFSGATILGDGVPSLILDVSSLL
ncbi:MAG TPA: chemotaxis protein CheA [Gemmatimonadaceae bacterium]|nr:chemotaxis protein CheA [Gemmatimonadaceae bacterium]